MLDLSFIEENFHFYLYEDTCFLQKSFDGEVGIKVLSICKENCKLVSIKERKDYSLNNVNNSSNVNFNTEYSFQIDSFNLKVDQRIYNYEDLFLRKINTHIEISLKIKDFSLKDVIKFFNIKVNSEDIIKACNATSLEYYKSECEEALEDYNKALEKYNNYLSELEKNRAFLKDLPLEFM